VRFTRSAPGATPAVFDLAVLHQLAATQRNY